jgi:phospholipid/cholesterol/gamma-HCH transport system permease protein
MNVAVRVDRQGDHASLVMAGPFDLAHTMAVRQAVEGTVARLSGCVAVDIDLAQLDRIDGAGAVLLARFLDQLDAEGRRACVVEGYNPKAARLIALYRERGTYRPAVQTHPISAMARRHLILVVAVPSHCRRQPRPQDRSIGVRCPDCCKRSVQTRCRSQAQPTC